MHTGPARNAGPVLKAGSVVWCCTGFAYFYDTRAKVDVWIWTPESRSTSHFFNCVPYRLKSPKVLKSPKMVWTFKYFIKTVARNLFRAAEWDAKLGPDPWIRTRQKSSNTQNAYKSGCGPDPQIESKVMRIGPDSDSQIRIQEFLCWPQIRIGSVTYGTDPLPRILEP